MAGRNRTRQMPARQATKLPLSEPSTQHRTVETTVRELQEQVASLTQALDRLRGEIISEDGRRTLFGHTRRIVIDILDDHLSEVAGTVVREKLSSFEERLAHEIQDRVDGIIEDAQARVSQIEAGIDERLSTTAEQMSEEIDRLQRESLDAHFGDSEFREQMLNAATQAASQAIEDMGLRVPGDDDPEPDESSLDGPGDLRIERLARARLRSKGRRHPYVPNEDDWNDNENPLSLVHGRLDLSNEEIEETLVELLERLQNILPDDDSEGTVLVKRIRRIERRLAHPTPPQEFRAAEERIRNALAMSQRASAGPESWNKLDAVIAYIEERGFYVARSTVERILRVLPDHPILILSGPPGSGKSVLAKLLPAALIGGSATSTEVTADETWTAYDAIGGLSMRGRFPGPFFGAVTQAILRAIEEGGRHWCIIDEINRGDVSKYLGSLLNGLGHTPWQLELRHAVPSDSMNSMRTLRIPPGFRIIGTMNSFDSESLFDLGEALKDRRAIVVDMEPLLVDEEVALCMRIGVTPTLLEAGYPANQHTGRIRALSLREGTTAIVDLVARVRALRHRTPVELHRPCELGSATSIRATRIMTRLRLGGADVVSAVDTALSDVLRHLFTGTNDRVAVALRDEIFVRQQTPKCARILYEHTIKPNGR